MDRPRSLGTARSRDPAQDHAVGVRRRALDAALAELGWADMLSDMPELAIPLGVPAARRNRFARLGSQRRGAAGRRPSDRRHGPPLPYAGGGWVVWERTGDPRARRLGGSCRCAGWTRAIRSGWPRPGGRWAGGWSGSARAMLALARQHALDRVQFGRPIASFQAVRHRLAETLVAIEGAEATLSLPGADNPRPDRAAGQGRGGQGRADRGQALPAGARRHRLHRRTRPAPPREAGPGARRTAGQLTGTHPRGGAGCGRGATRRGWRICDGCHGLIRAV